MKKIVLLLMGGLGVVALQAQTSHDAFLAKTFPAAGIKAVESETSGGNVSVYGQATGDARVEMYVQRDNGWGSGMSKEEIQKRLDEQYDITIDKQGEKLVATAHQKRNWDNNWRHGLSISFVIYVPTAVSSHVRTSGGNIEMKELTGNENFQTSGGNLDIDHLSGTILGRTSGGNVAIHNSHDDIDLRTSGGNMEAMYCEGKIQMETSGGNVSLRGVKGSIHASTSGGEVEGGKITGNLDAHTSGGNIDLDDVAASLSASTSGGNIRVHFLSTKSVDLSNSSGDISLSLPPGQGMDLRISGERVHSTTLDNFRGTFDEHHIDGTLNGGGIPVRVDGNSGEVHLSFNVTS
jgi:DUF4097 and DUF4098 domain-containing protein YvlB